MHTVRLHNMIMHTKVLGPSIRCAIWFQGCNRQCPGCMSPTSRPVDGGTVVSVEEVIRSVLEVNDIEGITVSGGEPFLQVEALYEILKGIREKKNLGIIIYSGYTIQQLRNMNNKLVNEILDKFTDILIDGEYIEDLNDGMALRGSMNQIVHFLTERYINQRELYAANHRNAEVIASGNDLFFVGIPSKETLSQWHKTIDNISSDNISWRGDGK